MQDYSVGDKIINWIIQNVVEGKWKSGDKIPSIGFIQIKFNASKEQVLNVLKKFTHIRLLQSIERVGYFIKEDQHRSFFKRESKTDGCDTFVAIEQKNQKLFEASELWKIPKFINHLGRFTQSNYLAFTKLYFHSQTKQNIKKISFSLVDNSLVQNGCWNIHMPLYKVFLCKNIVPAYRLTKIENTINIPSKVKKILNIKSDYLLLKYVAILDNKKKLLHAAKIYINPVNYDQFHIDSF